MSLVRKCVKWVLQGIVRSVKSASELARVGFVSRWETPMHGLKTTGFETAVIIANGPSLDAYLKRYPRGIENADHMCVNAFSLTPAYEVLRPRFSVFVDPSFWTIPCSHRMEEYRRAVYGELVRKTAWEHVVLTPVQSRGCVQRMMNPPRAHLVFRSFNGTIVSRSVPFALRNLLYGRGLAIPSCQTVVNSAIGLAVRMGYRNVYVVGADASFLEGLFVDPVSNLLSVASRHFAEEPVPAAPIYKDAEEAEPMLLHEYLEAVARMFEGYHEVWKYAKARNVNVVNASEFSWIDALPRGTL